MLSCHWVVEHRHEDQHVEDDAQGGEDAGRDGDEERVAVSENKLENVFSESCVVERDAASRFEPGQLIFSVSALVHLHLFQVLQGCQWGCTWGRLGGWSAWLTRFGDQTSCYRILSWPLVRS